MDLSKIKVIAMDLDGTLTQHKTPLCGEHRRILKTLSEDYKLLMVGAGQVMRIFNQLEQFPIDVIGNYGLQYGKYKKETGEMEICRDEFLPCDREGVKERIEMLRKEFGFTEYAGDSVEYHPSGCVTFPILGTRAVQEDKLAFDPDRAKRRKIYDRVVETFSDYCVFIGGSSSFDMAPRPFDKYHALDLFCKENGFDHDQVVYIGDDYGQGGNDESVYQSDIPYLIIDSYLDFPKVVAPLLEQKKKLFWTQSTENIFVAAHRGWRSRYPENTMAAFRGALELGVDQIETDVRITKDGELVLIHDPTVDRTTNGSGKVCEMTLAELQSLDAGQGERIPKLRDLMELVKDHPTLTLDLELKEYPAPGWEEVSYSVADRVIAMAEEYGFKDRCVFNTFPGKLHEYLEEKYGKSIRRHVFYPQSQMEKHLLVPCAYDPYPKAYCTCVCGLADGSVTTEEVRNLHKESGVRIWVGAYVKDEERVELARRMGAELITCDNPDEILAILRKKGLHR